MPPFEPGSETADEYHVERLLGQGGMAVVFPAEALGRSEALAIFEQPIAEETGANADRRSNRLLGSVPCSSYLSGLFSGRRSRDASATRPKTWGVPSQSPPQRGSDPGPA